MFIQVGPWTKQILLENNTKWYRIDRFALYRLISVPKMCWAVLLSFFFFFLVVVIILYPITLPFQGNLGILLANLPLIK